MGIVQFNDEKETFARIYDTYGAPIYRFIYYKTYHRETAEDLTSATFLKALDKFDTYNPAKGHISSWLYRIARNQVIDHFRKKRKAIDLEDVWDLADENEIALDISRQEELSELRKVLGTLPMEQRDILIMRIWQDIPYKEIAEVMGKSEGACKMIFTRTIAKLKKEMAAFALILLFKYLV